MATDKPRIRLHINGRVRVYYEVGSMSHAFVVLPSPDPAPPAFDDAMRTLRGRGVLPPAPATLQTLRAL